jgi:hypothetical protein
MRSVNRSLIAIILGIAAMGPTTPVDAFGSLPPNGLRGINASTVHVISIPSPVASDADSAVQTAVTQRLVAGHVVVLSEADCALRDDCAYLEIRVRTLTSKSGALVIFVVEASVPQLVKLVRDPSIDLGASVATYRDVEFGVVSADRALVAVSTAAVELARRYAVVSRRENQ